MFADYKCLSHPEGMLDRDQRTTYNLNLESTEKSQLSCSTKSCDITREYFDVTKIRSKSTVNSSHLRSDNFCKKKVTRFSQKLKEFILALFCLSFTQKALHLTPIMAMPVQMTYEHNNHSLPRIKAYLSNPCGYEDTVSEIDSTDNPPQFELENKDVKFYLGNIKKSAKTGLSDFSSGYLSNFFHYDFQISHEEDKIIRHHEAWKHQSNPNLLPNGKHLEIDFLKGLSQETIFFTKESAENFDVRSETDILQLLKFLEDCDERLQRLLIVFHQMYQNLDDFNINFRQDEFLTENIRKVYSKAIDIIRACLCDVRSTIHKLYGAIRIADHSVKIVDVDSILSNPFKTDSIGDWVNVRQLHDQLNYMALIFDIWVRGIKERK